MVADEDQKYLRAAELVYARMERLYEIDLKMQGDYGKWLISSLLFLHSAAIGGLLFKASGVTAPPYLYALWWFVGGIIFALGAGFSAWWNYTFSMEVYAEAADVRMLTDQARWPKWEKIKRIETTMRIAIGAGFISLFCLVCGAANVCYLWH
jgi:hypothetical protein